MACKREVKRQPLPPGRGRPVEPRTTSSGSKSSSSGYTVTFSIWFTRIDSAALLTKDPALPEFGLGDPSPYTDRDDVHDI